MKAKCRVLNAELQVHADELSYEALTTLQPKLIRELKEAINQGVTAKEIETQLLCKYGERLTTLLAIGAAYHIEKGIPNEHNESDRQHLPA